MGLPPASDSDMLKVVPSWPASEGEAKMIELLTNNHLEKILDLFDGANRDIRIISPFLSVAMAQRLCDSIRERGLRCAFITRFYIEDMVWFSGAQYLRIQVNCILCTMDDADNR